MKGEAIVVKKVWMPCEESSPSSNTTVFLPNELDNVFSDGSVNIISILLAVRTVQLS
jgi:hypothetical protein